MRSKRDSRAKPSTARRVERASALAGIAAVALVACGEVRDRPLPTSADTRVELAVQIVAPLTRTSPTALAGQTIDVVIRGSEPGGRLRGLGYVARRSGPSPVTVDSATTFFVPVPDSVLTFPLDLPSDLPNNAQIDVYGLAFGLDGGDIVTAEPQSFVVLQCPPQASWC